MDLISSLIKLINKYNIFNNNIDINKNYKEKIINFLIEQYGDPRESNWNQYVDEQAQNIFKGWLNAKDVKFFVEYLVDDNNDLQDRKVFWIDFADKIEEAIFIFSKETSSYEKNKTIIEDMYQKLKNKRMFLLPKLKTNIFIMKIKNLKIVEFSEKNNACFIYNYDEYNNAKIDSVLYSNSARNQTTVENFKRNDIVLDKINHRTSLNANKDWQDRLREKIENLIS